MFQDSFCLAKGRSATVSGRVYDSGNEGMIREITYLPRYLFRDVLEVSSVRVRYVQLLRLMRTIQRLRRFEKPLSGWLAGWL